MTQPQSRECQGLAPRQGNLGFTFPQLYPIINS
jgi:hypothetical protein